MSRIAFAAAIVFWLGFHSFGQTGDRRIDDALAEVTLLKRALAEQDLRIKDLEKTVKALQSWALQNSRDQAAISTPISPSTTAWKNASDWKRVKEGMSYAQVVVILGKPTWVKNISPYESVFYQDDIPGSGSVTGTIELKNDRVWQINTPRF